MDFQLTIIPADGGEERRIGHATEGIRRGADGVVTGFRMMMEQNPPVACVEEELLNSVQMTWQQASWSAAFAMFSVADKPKLTWLYLFQEEPDEVVRRLWDEMIASWPSAKQIPAWESMPPERPLAVCVLWPPMLSESEQRPIANLGVCLAAAFFELAAEPRGRNSGRRKRR